MHSYAQVIRLKLVAMHCSQYDEDSLGYIIGTNPFSKDQLSIARRTRSSQASPLLIKSNPGKCSGSNFINHYVIF